MGWADLQATAGNLVGWSLQVFSCVSLELVGRLHRHSLYLWLRLVNPDRGVNEPPSASLEVEVL